MRNKIKIVGLMLGLLLLLSGCLSQGGEEFYALPQLPQDYLALQETINGVIRELDAEYAAPASGSNAQNIQLQDLDGDGKRETAVAFFRVTNSEKPLKIYFFRQNPISAKYEVAWVIEGEGTGVYSITFENLGGTDEKEVIVSWQISAKVQSLSAYSLQRGGNAVELMRSGYTKAAVIDMDRDNDKEIVLVQLDVVENNSSAELYDYDNGVMLLKSKTFLSLNITNIVSAKAGTLTDLSPALFVSSDFENGEGRVTDVLVLRDGKLFNLTMNETRGMSLSTIRYYKDFKDANGRDINNDGILELPLPEALPSVSESGHQLYVIHWYQYDPDGKAHRECTTFHSYDDGWYLILPDEWQGKIAAARRDSSGSAAGSERAVTFYYYVPVLNEEGETQVRLEEFLTIYRLTGTNRNYRATLEGRFIIFESGDVVYAAQFRESKWDCGLDKDDLLERFYRIEVDWSAEN